MPARLAPDKSRGYIVAVGTPLLADGEQQIARRLLALCGQRPLLPLLHVGDLEAAGLDELDATLMGLGAGRVPRIALTSRAEAERPQLLAMVENADAVLLAALHPLQLSTLIGGTVLARLLRRRNADGMPLVGLGAGAVVLSEHMLAGGEAALTPRLGGVTLAPGLGLTNRVVIDQGGAASHRLGRLLGALALNPFALGLGIDAATAAFIGPDNVMEIVGHGGATVVDPSDVGASSVADAQDHAPISITNLRLHVLARGARYDLDFRRPL